jgi:hypothetical protein
MGQLFSKGEPMATVTVPSYSKQTISLVATLRDVAATFIEGAQDGLEMARSYRMLSHMAEDELKKRGLTRANVARAVGTGRARV